MKVPQPSTAVQDSEHGAAGHGRDLVRLWCGLGGEIVLDCTNAATTRSIQIHGNRGINLKNSTKRESCRGFDLESEKMFVFYMPSPKYGSR